MESPEILVIPDGSEEMFEITSSRGSMMVFGQTWSWLERYKAYIGTLSDPKERDDKYKGCLELSRQMSLMDAELQWHWRL